MMMTARRFLSLLTLLLSTFLAAQTPPAQRILSEQELPARRDSIRRVEKRDLVISLAREHLGKPYRYAARGPSHFDCSGLTSYVFEKAGIPLLRSSRDQFTQGKPVRSIMDLARGDLVFLARGSQVYHVGIVVDPDPEHDSFTFIHASYGGVIISDYREEYYKAHYFGARRVIL